MTKIGQNWVMVSSWASLDGLAVLSVSDIVYIHLSRGLYRGNFINIIVKFSTKILQNRLVVASRAPLEGLVVLSVSDIVCTVLYPVYYI